MKKQFKILAMILMIALTLTACGSGNEEEKDNGTTDNEFGKVIYLTPGALGDNAFSDSVNTGVEKIKKEFDADAKVIENSFDSSKYGQSVEAAFQWGPDVIFTDAYGMEDLVKDYADQFPDTKVVNLDFVLQNAKKTISSVTFIQEEGAFMAGVTAALITESDLEFANSEKIVGAMGGEDIPVIQSFIHGFRQGVEFVNPEIQVITNFAGTFSDPSKGKQATKQLYAQGADVVFQIAGVTGNGALEAAFEENKYVIGVDSNQNSLYPGNVVTSVVKDLGGAIHEIYTMMLNGEFKENEVYEYGLGPNGMYLAIDEYSKDILTEEMLKTIADIEAKIVSGEVKVERY